MADEVLPTEPGHKVDICPIKQLERQSTTFSADLNDISNGVLSAELNGDEELMKLWLEMDKLIFKLGLHMKRLLHAQRPEDSPPTTDDVIKLAEIEAPLFDVDFLNWGEI